MHSLAAKLRGDGASHAAAAAAFLVTFEGENGDLAPDPVDVLVLLVVVVGVRNLHGDLVVSPLFVDHPVECRAQRVGRQRGDDDGAGLGGLARLQGCSCGGFRRRTSLGEASCSSRVSSDPPLTAFAAKQLVRCRARAASPPRDIRRSSLARSPARSNRLRRLPVFLLWTEE